MKVYYTNDCTRAPVGLVEWVESGLDGADFGQGQLEDMRQTVENIKGAFGRLLDCLADKGVIDGPDIHRIVNAFENSNMEVLR